MFMQALVNMSELVGGGDGAQKAQYLSDVLSPLNNSFSQLLQQQSEFVKVAHTPAVMLTVTNILEQFRGVSRANVTDNTAIVALCSRYFGPMVGLVEVYKNFPDVVLIVLKFFCDFVETQVENLDDEQLVVLFAAIIDLFKQYSACNVGKVRTSTATASGLASSSSSSSSLSRSSSSSSSSSSFLHADQQQDAYKDLLTLLKLLCILSGQSNAADNVPEVICLGVSIILPLITKELLEVSERERERTAAQRDGGIFQHPTNT